MTHFNLGSGEKKEIIGLAKKMISVGKRNCNAENHQ